MAQRTTKEPGRRIYLAPPPFALYGQLTGTAQALSRLLVQQRNRTGHSAEKEVAGGSEEQEQGETWLTEGALPTFDLHAGMAIVADQHRTRDEDEDRCLPTSSGRAALQVRGETSRPPTLPLKRLCFTFPLCARCGRVAWRQVPHGSCLRGHAGSTSWRPVC